MTNLTYWTVINNYPDGLIIDSSEPNKENQVVGWCYLKNEDGSIHRTLFNTKPVVMSRQEMIDSLHEDIKNWIANENKDEPTN
jgi:hypothetical protein